MRVILTVRVSMAGNLPRSAAPLPAGRGGRDDPSHDGTMELRRRRLTDADVAPLLAGLAEEYETRYRSGDEMRRATADEFDPPDGAFLILVDDGVTIAGGGFRYLAPG